MFFTEIGNVIMTNCTHLEAIHYAQFPHSALNVTILMSPLMYAVISRFVIVRNIKV
jgi:hypothetical protein